MIVEEKGKGETSVAVICNLHGDETCGKKAISDIIIGEKFRESVKFIIANSKATNIGERYIDKDLNRSFPGDKESDIYEERIASQILDEISDYDNVISLHSTESTNIPFYLFNKLSGKKEMLKKIPVRKGILKKGFDIGDLPSNFEDTISVECGYKGTKQAENNAKRIVRDFLLLNNCIIGDRTKMVSSKVDLYSMGEKVNKKDDVFFFWRNFEPVESGEVYATSNDKNYTAEEKFTPLIMSSMGYEKILGFKGKFLKTI